MCLCIDLAAYQYVAIVCRLDVVACVKFCIEMDGLRCLETVSCLSVSLVELDGLTNRP